MTLEKTTFDGGWTNSNGQNTYPYKADGETKGVHASREANVHNGEANDPRNYE